MIYGEKTILRAVERMDIRQLWEWEQDYELMRLRSHPTPPKSLDKAEREFEESLRNGDSDEIRLCICTLDSELIGETALHEIDHRVGDAEFSIAIGDRAYQGRGYGSDATRTILKFAFKQLNLHRITLHVHDFNERAIKTYIRCGFKEEGRLREAEFMDGQYSDVLVMGLLREEFEEIA